MIGIDDAEMGEFAYDYVSLDAELGLAQHPHGVHEVPNEIDGALASERRGGHAGPRDVHLAGAAKKEESELTPSGSHEKIAT